MQEDYEIIVIVSLFIITDFFLKTAPRMQEDYEIIVIVSLFMRLIFS
jgi:hypothetical protein